jgi:hypothetical protein
MKNYAQRTVYFFTTSFYVTVNGTGIGFYGLQLTAMLLLDDGCLGSPRKNVHILIVFLG